MREVDPDQLRRAERGGGPEERILVHITEHPATALLIRRAWRISEFLQAGCVAVYIRRSSSKAASETIEKHLRFARDLHIETRVIEGEDEAESLVEFARLNKVTQIYIARPQYRRPQRVFTTNMVHRIVRLSPDMRLTIVAERPEPHA